MSHRSRHSRLIQRTDISVRRRHHDLLHVEAPGTIINIRTGLKDRFGRPVTAVEVLADGSRHAGDPEWWLDGNPALRTTNVRVVRTSKE